MALFALKTYDKVTGMDIPDANALVQGTGRDIATVWRNSDSCNAILDGQVKHLLVRLEIPEADAPIAASRSDDSAVLGEIQRVDILLVAGELVLDGTARDIPNSNDFVFGTSREVLAVGTEADAADVQIAVFGKTGVLEKGNWCSGLDVEDLS